MMSQWKKYAVVFFGCLALFLSAMPAHAAVGDKCSCSLGVSNCASTCGSSEVCIVNSHSDGGGICQTGSPTAVGTPATGMTVSIAAPSGPTTFSGFLCKIIDFINTTLLPPIAIFMTLLAGFFFMLSGQDPQKATLARRVLLYTVIGIALFLVAPGVVGVIADIVNASGSFSSALSSCSESMSADSLTLVIVKLVNWFAWFVALASVAMGLYAGFLYLTSRGDPRQTQQAAKALSYVIIGVAVSVISFSIVGVVGTFLATLLVP